jgi:hypothetical protein
MPFRRAPGPDIAAVRRPGRLLTPHSVTQRLGERLVCRAGRGLAQPVQQLGRGLAAAVAVLDQERGHPLLAQVAGRGGGGVPGQEFEADRRLDVGEDGRGARPVRLQQRGQLVSGGDPHLDQVIAGAHHGAQRLCLVAIRGGGGQPVIAQPQVLGDDRGVPGIGLGAGQHLAFPPGLDRVRADRHHRVPGLQQQVHQPPGRPLDRDRQIRRVAIAGQAPHQRCDPFGGVLDGELGGDRPGRVQHAHRVLGRSPVDPGEEPRLGQRQRHLISSRWQRRPGGGEAGSRAVTNRRSAARLPVAGLQPRESRGRRCHTGPSQATEPGRLPGSRRVPTPSTLTMPVRKRVP